MALVVAFRIVAFLFLLLKTQGRNDSTPLVINQMKIINKYKVALLFKYLFFTLYHRLETVISGAQQLGINSAELLDELVVAGSELGSDT